MQKCEFYYILKYAHFLFLLSNLTHKATYWTNLADKLSAVRPNFHCQFFKSIVCYVQEPGARSHRRKSCKATICSTTWLATIWNTGSSRAWSSTREGGKQPVTRVLYMPWFSSGSVWPFLIVVSTGCNASIFLTFIGNLPFSLPAEIFTSYFTSWNKICTYFLLYTK